MDLETTTEGTEAQEPSDLELIQATRTTEKASTPEEKPAAATEPETVPESPEADPKEEELQRLKRIIATDPQKRALYEQERYGVQPVAPQPKQAQQEAPKPKSLDEAFAEAFQGDDYDPFNMAHQAFITQFHLNPAMAYIDEVKAIDKQQEQQQRQRQIEQIATDADTSVQKLFIAQLPALEEWLKAESPSLEQKTLLEMMTRSFQAKLFEAFPEREDQSHLRLWMNPDVHQDVVRQVMPEVKQLASKLGLLEASLPAPKVNKDMARESYVESSNAVPAGAPVNPFDEALAKDDYAAAFGAIRQM